MSTKDNSVFRELKADELEKVSGSGGFIHYPPPPVGPAFPSPSPISGGTGGGGGGGGSSGNGNHQQF
jgi:hypothetical protein